MLKGCEGFYFGLIIFFFQTKLLGAYLYEIARAT